MSHITQMRAKYSRKFQRPGYETNYEPQYAEFELVSTFGDEEQADDSDLHGLMDQAAHIVNTKLGLDSDDRGGEQETEVLASRDGTRGSTRALADEREVQGVKSHSGNPTEAATIAAPGSVRRRGSGSASASTPEQSETSASDATTSTEPTSSASLGRRRGGAAANPPATAETSAPLVTSGSARRGGGGSGTVTQGQGPTGPTPSGSAGNATTSLSEIKDTDLSKAASQLAAKRGTDDVFKVLSMYGAKNVFELKGEDKQAFLDLVKSRIA
jgi:hypothetical protein